MVRSRRFRMGHKKSKMDLLQKQQNEFIPTVCGTPTSRRHHGPAKPADALRDLRCSLATPHPGTHPTPCGIASRRGSQLVISTAWAGSSLDCSSPRIPCAAAAPPRGHEAATAAPGTVRGTFLWNFSVGGSWVGSCDGCEAWSD